MYKKFKKKVTQSDILKFHNRTAHRIKMVIVKLKSNPSLSCNNIVCPMCSPVVRPAKPTRSFNLHFPPEFLCRSGLNRVTNHQKFSFHIPGLDSELFPENVRLTTDISESVWKERQDLIVGTDSLLTK